MNFQNVLPGDIEKRSFEMITEELGQRKLPEDLAPIIKRVIHTSADFDYADNLVFSEGVLKQALDALKHGATIITDTNMGKSGINKGALAQLGCVVDCYIANEDVAAMAKANGTTRATAAVDKACQISGPVIFAVGNAPTALVRLYENMAAGLVKPALIIGVPVGFVNVVESKELIMSTEVPYIVAKGRKGGSNVAAAIVNALMYIATERKL
ncbi:MAG: precorrin-8X methylmutase [Eubacteriales bacterium]